MTKQEAQIRYWADKFFPHLVNRYALVAVLLRLQSRITHHASRNP